MVEKNKSIGKALMELTKNADGWYQSEEGKVLHHLAEVKAGVHKLPCGLVLIGGDIVSYFVENISRKEFCSNETVAVSGLKFGGIGSMTFIPIEILHLNHHQQKAFASFHEDFPRDFFNERKKCTNI
jgi:hypothetical protein